MDTTEAPGKIVFSARQWEGEYWSRDLPNGVESISTTSAIYVINTDDTEPPRKVVEVDGRGDAPRYSPDGEWVYFQALFAGHHAIFRCREDGAELENMTRSLQPAGDYYGYRPSQDGTKMLYVYHDGQIGRVGIMNPDGTDAHLIAPDIGYHYMADISPDGRSVAFAHTARGYVLALKHLDTGELVTLTPDFPESFFPQFTPDGKTLIFFRRDGDVYRVDVDGSDLRRLTQGNNYVEFKLSPKDSHGSSDPPAISPDGTKIAYLAMRDGVAQVHTMNLDGSEQTQLTFRATPCARVMWSPDGRQLAFVSWEGDTTQLFIMPGNGGTPRKLTNVQGAVYFHAWKSMSDGER